ncbi:hypothetical protein EMCG_05568 [[Emmonsia] crescens]|uniref:Mitochondrial ribosomal protein MRP51 n=1 Tax=[Emmonsia] crescens TaxID=73230 RepID=A0A0G2HN80_9EURO|nr:hypothetical protein EMCG_05568 [Emmonsia crescens UAMH 3008]
MAARLSPTANLLRRSRLFALPPTLSPPTQTASSSQIAESDTATLPYPIRAAIVTPDSSLARGDWGLKRPLPAKSTIQSSSTPVVRINALDTFEHVTDFESAGDHIKTLAKWQELSLPISLPKNNGIAIQVGGGKHESVFESKIDNTHESPNAQSPDSKRFRFGGPWLAGQTDIEFDRYLASVRRRKPEFMKKLRQLIADGKLADARRKAREGGKNLDDLQKPPTISEEEFQTAIRTLRADPTALGPIISKFLDLPPPPQTPSHRIHLRSWSAAPSEAPSAEYGRRGPPKTHPSAGLSYLRTGAQIVNHPVVGPQKHSRPVPARILRPKRRHRGNAYKAIVGVGGIVTEDVNAHAFREHNGPGGITDFDPDVPGGAKYWVHPVRASVTSEGKISLAIDRASDTAKALHGGLPEAEEPLPDYVRGTQRTFEELAPRRSINRGVAGAGTGTNSSPQDILNLLRESKESKSDYL